MKSNVFNRVTASFVALAFVFSALSCVQEEYEISEENLNLEVGDEWTFPTSYDVYDQKIGDNHAQYIFIEVNGNAKKFYPSTFTKSRTIYNEDGTSTEQRVHTEGTAAELFRSAGSVDEAMKLLAGKKVKVTDVKTVRTLRYGTTSLMNATIPTIDLVE